MPSATMWMRSDRLVTSSPHGTELVTRAGSIEGPHIRVVRAEVIRGVSFNACSSPRTISIMRVPVADDQVAGSHCTEGWVEKADISFWKGPSPSSALPDSTSK